MRYNDRQKEPLVWILTPFSRPRINGTASILKRGCQGDRSPLSVRREQLQRSRRKQKRQSCQHGVNCLARVRVDASKVPPFTKIKPPPSPDPNIRGRGISRKGNEHHSTCRSCGRRGSDRGRRLSVHPASAVGQPAQAIRARIQAGRRSIRRSTQSRGCARNVSASCTFVG